MCSCGSEDGCLGIKGGCRCVCHHGELLEQNKHLRKSLEEVWIVHDEIVAAVKPILPAKTLAHWQEACRRMRDEFGS